MNDQAQNVAIGAALVGLFVIFGVMFLSMERNTLPNLEDPVLGEEDATIPQIGEGVLVSRAYGDGTHIYAGIVSLPTPCHSVETEVTVAESFPEQVTIGLRIIPPEEDVLCTQVVTPTLFSVSFEASEEALVRIVQDGKQVGVRFVETLPLLGEGAN